MSIAVETARKKHRHCCRCPMRPPSTMQLMRMTSSADPRRLWADYRARRSRQTMSNADQFEKPASEITFNSRIP